ncbi:hypothetical protein Tco_0528192 [Tanacetum coccineum]
MVMAHPLSPNHDVDLPELAPGVPNPTPLFLDHVLDFSHGNLDKDPKEDSEEEPEEEEELEETDMDMDMDVDGGSSSDALVAYDLKDLMPSAMRRDIDLLHGSVRVLTRQMSTQEAAEALTQSREREGRRHMDLLDFDLGVVENNNDKIEHQVVSLGERDLKIEQDDVRGENKRLRRMLKSAKESVMFARMKRDKAERDIYHLRVWAYGFYKEMILSRVMEKGQPKLWLMIMPPEKIWEDPQEERGDPQEERENPHEELEDQPLHQLFVNALSLNSQVATLGLDNANRISWTELRKLMTDEFCPRDEIQRMEQ